ncbi:hypothetical protein HYX13_00125 [Candidatus Woesearchaeota archaeon]|nr:hypothetical protein [Candidatus Woesearchaeota archaeon]
MRVGEEISVKNIPILPRLFKHQKKLFLLLFFFVCGSFFLLRILKQKVFLAGNQTYYLLTFLHIPETELSWVWIFPPLIGFFCFLLLRHLALQLEFSQESIFFFCLFLFLTPAFTFSFTTLTFQSISLFLFLLGIFLFFHKKKWLQYFSPIPFLATMMVDIFTSSLLVLLLFFILIGRKERKIITILLLTMLCFALTAQFFFFNSPLLLGPFQQESLLKTLFAELGSEGISIFIVLLACIGVVTCWKKTHLRRSYLLLGGSFLGTLFVQRNYIFFALMIAFFAGEGVLYFYDRKWIIPVVKWFTLFAIILGVLLTFLISFKEQSQISPSWDEVNAFSWMRENIPVSAKIFSLTEHSYYLDYFAERDPYIFPHEQNKEKEKNVEEIVKSTYISTTFPLLQEQNITFIYLTPEMRKDFSTEQGLFFLLRNERFKLRFSQKGYEVWEFFPEEIH